MQWGDQDAFNHVNNVVYYRWFESARIAYFRRMGLMGIDSANRIGPILASSTCEYRKPITFPDTIRVGIRVTRIGRTSIGFEHRIVSEELKTLAAEGISTTVVVNYDDYRPHPVPSYGQAGNRVAGRSRILNGDIADALYSYVIVIFVGSFHRICALDQAGNLVGDCVRLVLCSYVHVYWLRFVDFGGSRN